MIDAVLMVDWSAAARPTTGADSVWWAFARVGASGLERLENPATRRGAMAEIESLLATEAEAGRRVLAGFDFPFGYPEGAAAALAGEADWRALWRLLETRVEDGPENANNRFALAHALNREAYDGEGPFWGRPHNAKAAMDGPPLRKPAGYGGRYPAERRRVERRVRSAHPVWKLFTTGSVGGQTLLGIAALARLRRALGSRTAIWPFETGLAAPRLDAPVVVAEIYPSLLPPHAGEAVKDAGQVRAMAERLAALAAQDALTPLLCAPDDAGAGEIAAAEREEAWILGAGRETALRSG